MKAGNIERIARGRRAGRVVQAGGQRSANNRAADETASSAPCPPQPESDGPKNHDARGRFVKGNRAAMTTALHSRHAPELMRQVRQQFLTEALADHGGDAPTLLRAQLTNRAVVQSRITQL